MHRIIMVLLAHLIQIVHLAYAVQLGPIPFLGDEEDTSAQPFYFWAKDSHAATCDCEIKLDLIPVN